MHFIFDHTWIIFIAVTIINGIIFKVRSQSYIAKNPDLKDGYNKLILGWLICFNIPWVIIGIGDLTGLTNDVWDYFPPDPMNPWVLVFHAYLVAFGVIGSYWIFLRGGADFLVKHPGIFRFGGIGSQKDITSTTTIKIVWSVIVAAGIANFLIAWL